MSKPVLIDTPTYDTDSESSTATDYGMGREDPSSASSLSPPVITGRVNHCEDFAPIAKPFLIYSTSTGIFSGAELGGTMEIHPVHEHPRFSQNKLWDAVRDQTAEILDDDKIKWTSIHFIRFSYSNSNKTKETVASNPTLFIGVLPGSTNADVARTSANKILELLSRTDISNIDVAFRESVAYRSSSRGPRLWPSLNLLNHPLNNVLDWVTTPLSMPIAALETPHSEGTFGFYFKFSGDLYGITARHVLLPVETYQNDSYIYKHDPVDPDLDKKWVVLMGHTSFASFRKSLDDQLRDIEDSIWRLNQHLGNPQHNQLVINNYLREQRIMEEQRTAINVFLQKLDDTTDDGWALIQNRIIGHIVWSPPIAPKPLPGGGGFTLDLCVIKLVNDKFLPNLKHQSIEPASGLQPIKFSDNRIPLDRFKEYFPGESPQSRSYPLTKILPAEDINSYVFKCGRTTGTTIGLASNFLSAMREYDKPIGDFISIDVPIYPVPELKKWGPFCKEGDSGAAVIGSNDDIVGLLTGFCESGIAVCTPMEWLWKEIEERFPGAVLCF